MMANPLVQDLDHVLANTPGWDELRGQRIFITGGTGFFGCWLLESFIRANEKLELGASALVLTRDANAFGKKAPHLAAHPAIQFWPGDVRSFDFPEGHYSHIIHAAVDARAKLVDDDPILMFDTIVEGTRRTLEFARHCGAKKFLFTSSGAVYGKQPVESMRIPEDYMGAPDPLDSRALYAASGEAKRAAETLCGLYARQHGIETKIARCFSFIGPYLPLNGNFAAGNFIRDGLAGGPIVVSGDGTPYRSYLYAADLAVWLWTILFRGASGRAYNVGAEEPITIGDLARMTAAAFSLSPKVVIMQKAELNKKPERYVPDTKRAREELGLKEWISLPEAIEKTVAWHRFKPENESSG
jgi:nucleoside-diphosphate-sugar epimerase